MGSELLRGKINTHASTFGKRLPSVGLTLDAEQTVGDDLPALTNAIRRALKTFQIVIVTGGLGPTFDDLTREAAAAATGRRLISSSVVLRDIQSKFKRARYRRMPPSNARQADVLEGARVILNAHGTAPGQWLPFSGKILILLPGPPRELHPMLEKDLLPALKRRFPAKPRAEAHLHFAGVGESWVDEQIRPLIDRAQKQKDVTIDFTILAHLGLVDFDIFISSASAARAQKVLQTLTKQVQQAIGPAFYGLDADFPLAQAIGNLLLRRKETVALAESCTGGMVAARMTDIAGSSRYLLGGVVAYDNRIKEQVIQVPAKFLRTYGAVSREVALAMAEGVRVGFGSTWGVSITGIAGPGGGTSQKPVGLVYIAVVSRNRKVCEKYLFKGERDAVRQRAVTQALDLLRAQLSTRLRP